MQQRENSAELARMLPWRESSNCVDAWLAVRDIEPVASRFPFPLHVDLDSESANKARQTYYEVEAQAVRPSPRRVQPPPAERVQQLLDLCESGDPRRFLNLCDEMTLEEYSTHYRFERFLIRTPGWMEADEVTRSRIVDAAKALITAESDEPEKCRSKPFSSLLAGYMPALWLVQERDPAWLDALPTSWWQRWSWYVLRELHPNMMDEPQEPKASLLKLFHGRAPVAIRTAVEEVAATNDPAAATLLSSLFDAFVAIDDSELDTRLCERLTAGDIPEDRVSDVAQFVLARSGSAVLSAYLTCLEPETASRTETVAVQAAVALLLQYKPECWDAVFDFLDRRGDLLIPVCTGFAGARPIGDRLGSKTSDITPLDGPRLERLISLLFEAFPPESDPKPDGKAHFGEPVDACREMRDSLLSWLGDQRSIEAVEALRSLERRFGTRYPWLRRPRARAERAWRLSNWAPIAPTAVADVLLSADNRLIRSGSDAVDGITAAIEQFGQRLRSESPNDLEDLWNRPRKGRPTPKGEERISDKLCVAIRDYFHDYAVTADREVQVFRRTLSPSKGGAPGSEIDVLYRVPAVGAVSGERIAVPIEVKLGHNPEARTGLRDQLVDRYMMELGTSFGVYVVVWMGPSMPKPYRAIWQSPELAQRELTEQAANATVLGERAEISTIVIDASLPRAVKRRIAKKKIKRNKVGVDRERATVRKSKIAKEVTKSKKLSTRKRPRKRPK